MPEPADSSAIPAAKPIDELTEVDSQAPGLHATAYVLGFIAEDRPLRFGGGVLNSPAPVIHPAMRELVRRGPRVLPDLIAHLSDQRPTKLTVGETFFMFRFFGDDYDPKVRPSEMSQCFRRWLHDYEPTARSSKWRQFFRSSFQKVFPPISNPSPFERPFRGGYTVKVGDVCFALIGQIVNRALTPVGYKPTAGLVINSPIESPVLAERVVKDWTGLDTTGHRASLVADAKSGGHMWTYWPALVRLRFYYPDEYMRLKASRLKRRIKLFEEEENKPS